MALRPRTRSISTYDESKNYPENPLNSGQHGPTKFPIKHKNRSASKEKLDLNESHEYIDGINSHHSHVGQPDGIRSHRALRVKHSGLVGLNSKSLREIQDLESVLSTAGGFVISTKLTSVHYILGKVGYELITLNGQKIGFVIPESNSTCVNKLCCHSTMGENDPMNYLIAGNHGEDLLTVVGLDEDNGTEDTVLVLEPNIHKTVGSIFYGFLGATDTLSLATSDAGRETSYMLPISVVDGAGNLAFIFRREAGDVFGFTEILSADGNAITMAEIIFDKIDLVQLVKSFKFEAAKATMSVVKSTHSRLSATEANLKAPAVVPAPAQSLSPLPSEVSAAVSASVNLQTPKKRKSLFRPELVNVFRVNFLEELSPQDKILMIGITVTILNRWLTKRPSKSKCTIV